VRLHICGNVRSILEGIGRLGCDIVDLDSMVPLDQARAKIGPRTFLLGNLDPVRLLRNGTPGAIRDALVQCHRQAGSRFIIGAGCEVPRDTPPENVRALLEYAMAPE
jgi:uroporphyrinogen-III decarboxylase